MTIMQKLQAKRTKKGFTLVELVIVIAILAILAAISIPLVSSIMKSANTSAGESVAHQLDSACKTYYTRIQSNDKTLPSGFGADTKVKDVADAEKIDLKNYTPNNGKLINDSGKIAWTDASDATALTDQTKLSEIYTVAAASSDNG